MVSLKYPKIKTFRKLPAIWYTTDIMVFEIYTKIYRYLGKAAILQGFASHCNILSKFVYILVYILNTMISVYYIFYSYNTLTRDMTKIYARFTRARNARVRVRIFSHIPSNRVITVIFYTPVDKNDYRL